MNRQRMKPLFAIATATFFSCVSSASFALSPFHADYQFNYNGKNLGSATRTLSQSSNQWTYVFAAKALGFASATETSKFTLKQGQIYSKNFSRNSKVLVRNDSLKIDFLPQQKLIKTQKNDQKRSFAWVEGALDELNAELQIREDIKNNRLKSQYLLTDAKEVEARKFVKEGTEVIKTPSGNYDTIKVVLKHDKPGRETIFWMAPKLDYLPVKVTHVDKKDSYGLLLKGYKGTN